ncbi:VWA domain-containing protein [uncultured Subdoligranulum sp.]|uniref:vWA domain-containing protein n=1 Tax=uncultured Subdoligranulum sp. TaxID=512298 RepID=UPI0025D763D5|nr:VWA domain-containing protein [uncultured Subdoligranulum sp.]
MATNVMIKEYPRNGSLNSGVIDSGQQRLMCVLLLDTSGSMEEGQLKEGISQFFRALREDPYATARVEVCIITFDDEARIAMPCKSVPELFMPDINCGGMTAMHQAVDLALEQIEVRKAQYKKVGTDYFRPWLFLLTDGYANDKDNGAFRRLTEAQAGHHVTAFPVAIGNMTDDETLHKLREDHMIFRLDKDNVVNLFAYLSNSVPAASQSKPGERVTLPNPAEYQITVEM